MKIIDNRQSNYVKFSTLNQGTLFKTKSGNIYLKISEVVADYTDDESHEVDEGEISIYTFIDENRCNALNLSDLTPSFYRFDNHDEVEVVNAELHIK